MNKCTTERIMGRSRLSYVDTCFLRRYRTVHADVAGRERRVTKPWYIKGICMLVELVAQDARVRSSYE